MLKASIIGDDGKHLMILGLSFNNLDELRQKPCGTYIIVKGDEIGVPGIEVMIFSGRTEQEMSHYMTDFIHPKKTKVKIDPRLKD
jgi:hypothetical protein